MRKTYKLDEVDCANCAAKMEDAVRKIAGVNSVTVSYITQKLTIDADDARFSAIMDEVKRVCAKVEPDCEIIM